MKPPRAVRGATSLHVVTVTFAALAVALTAVAVLAVHAATAHLDRPRLDERVRATEAAAQHLAGWLDGLADEANRAGSALEPWTVPPGPSPEAGEALDAVLARGPVAGALVVGPDGRVLAASLTRSQLLGLPRGEGVAAGALAGDPGVSGVIRDPLLRAPAVQAAAPLRDAEGRFAGAVVVDADLDRLQRVLDAVPVPGGVQTLLVAPDGSVLAPGRPIPEEGSLPELLRPPVEASAGGPGNLVHPAEAGEETVSTFAPVAHGWTLVLSEPAATFSEPLLRALTYGVVAPTAALALVASLVIGALGARTMRARREADAVQRAFLAVAGHELRTPLTLISGTVQTWQQLGDRAPPPFRDEALRTLAVQAARLQQLIERIIFAGQLEAGTRDAVRPVPCDIAPRLERALAQQRTLAPTHVFDLDVGRPLYAHADAAALERATQHLLENAVRYSAAGTVVTLSARRRGRHVEVAVTDQGVGLPSDPERLFGRFVQGETVDTRVRDEGGLGLGLYVVRSLVEAMGGSVRAERRPVGARFLVRLRAAPR